jgi:hypothetical protein
LGHCSPRSAPATKSLTVMLSFVDYNDHKNVKMQKCSRKESAKNKNLFFNA